jgi:hypothetical protein
MFGDAKCCSGWNTRSVCHRGPITAIIGACFFVVGTVLLILPYRLETLIVGLIFEITAFVFFCITSCVGGLLGNFISVTTHGDQSKLPPLILPFGFPLFFPPQKKTAVTAIAFLEQ